MNEKISRIIIFCIIIIIVVWSGIIALERQEYAICEFCISSNWTGILSGEIGLHCQKYQFTNYNETIKMKEWCENIYKEPPK